MQMKRTAIATTALVLSAGLSAAAWADANDRSLGEVLDDAGITASVKGKLINDADTKAHQINVETRNGVVQLNGFVDSQAARNEAGRLAAEASGVTSVQNNLEVRAGNKNAEQVIDDAALTVKVDSALAADKRTSALRVDVESNRGEVQLSGFAKDASERSAAEQVARSVDGVRSVSNKIAVR